MANFFGRDCPDIQWIGDSPLCPDCREPMVYRGRERSGIERVWACPMVDCPASMLLQDLSELQDRAAGEPLGLGPHDPESQLVPNGEGGWAPASTFIPEQAEPPGEPCRYSMCQATGPHEMHWASFTYSRVPPEGQ